MLTFQPDIKEQSPIKLDFRFRGNDNKCAGNDIKNLSWKDSVAVQKILDVLCQILAEEYCKTAREHPELFATKG